MIWEWIVGAGIHVRCIERIMSSVQLNSVRHKFRRVLFHPLFVSHLHLVNSILILFTLHSLSSSFLDITNVDYVAIHFPSTNSLLPFIHFAVL